MKILSISRSKLEITSAQLRRPNLTIGRSPVCDINLRAPGVAPIHFLVEWIGSGEFDPKQGAWSIVDISSTLNPEAGGAPEYAEGVVLSANPVQIGDLNFAILEDKLGSEEQIGGKILESFTEGGGTVQGELLELVQVRVDSGAIEEVRHVPVPKKNRKEVLLKDFKEFKVEWPGGEALLKLLLEEMPGCEVFRRGQKIEIKDAPTLRPNEILQVRWQGRDFFLRFVEELSVPPIPVEFFGDPLLKRIALVVIGIGLLILLVLSLYKVQEEEPPPPRIAKVEIPAEPKAKEETPPPQPEQVVKTPEPPVKEPVVTEKKESIEQTKSQKPEPSKQKQVVKTQEKATKPGKAAAPRQDNAPKEAPKAGLNAPAKVTDVNQVGLLSVLGKTASKGRGVKADKLINDTVVTDSISAHDQSKIVLRNPPSGTLGDGSSGSPNGSGESKLGSASTTLAGAGKYDPSSVGPIARKGGTSGMNVGSQLTGDGSGVGRGTELGSVDGGDFSVEGGGLDRETVRRVIASFRGQIRTCYERALLTNPKLEGRLVYSWRIANDGAVISAENTKATIESPPLKTCVLEVIRRMNFPKAPNGRSTKVIYPFVFQGKK